MSRPEIPAGKYSGKTPVYQFTYHTQSDIDSDIPYSAYEEKRNTYTKDKQIYGAIRGWNKFDTFVISPATFWNTNSDIAIGSGLGAFIDGVYIGELEDSPQYIWSGLSVGLNYLYVTLIEEDPINAGEFKSSRLRRSVATYSNTTGAAPAKALKLAKYWRDTSGTSFFDISPEEEFDQGRIFSQHIAKNTDPHGSLLNQTNINVSGLEVLSSAVVVGLTTIQSGINSSTFTVPDLTVTGNTSSSTVKADSVNLGTSTVSGNADLYGVSTVNSPVILDSGRTVDGRDLSTDKVSQNNHLSNTSNPHNVTTTQTGSLPTSGGTLTGDVFMSSGTSIDSVDIDADIKPLANKGNADAYHYHPSYSKNTVYQCIAPTYKGCVSNLTSINGYTEEISAPTNTSTQSSYYTLGDSTIGNSLKASWLLNDVVSGTCLDNYGPSHLNICASGMGMAVGPSAYYPVAVSLTGALKQYLWTGTQTNQLQGATAFTISLWAKFNSLPASGKQHILIGKWNDGPVNKFSWILYLENASGTYKLTFLVSSSGSGVTAVSQYAWAPSAGTWYHFVAQGTGANIRVKINNGAWQASAAFSGALYNHTYPLGIGQDNIDLNGALYSGGSTTDGIISCVSLWNSALSDADVTYLYNNYTPGEWSQFLGKDEYREIGQSFVPSFTGTLNSINLTGRKIGSPDYNTAVSVYSMNGTPNTLLGTSSLVSASGWSTGADASQTYTFNSGPVLSSGVPYCFTISGIGGGIGYNYLNLRRGRGNEVSSGVAWYRDPSAVWHQEPLPNRDLPYVVAQTNYASSITLPHNYMSYTISSGSSGSISNTIRFFTPEGVTQLNNIKFSCTHAVNDPMYPPKSLNLTFTDSAGTVFSPATGQNIWSDSWLTTTILGVASGILTYGVPCKINIYTSEVGGGAVGASYGETQYLGDIKLTYTR